MRGGGKLPNDLFAQRDVGQPPADKDNVRRMSGHRRTCDKVNREHHQSDNSRRHAGDTRIRHFWAEGDDKVISGS